MPRDNLLQSSPPPSNPIKRIHCDGSFDNDSHEAAIGIVITNAHGQICDGRAGRVICSSPIEAEAHALLEACSLAKLDSSSTIIFSNCKSLVDALSGEPSSWPWRCFAHLSSIVHILREANWISIKFVNRQHNKNADWVARNARLNTLPPNWTTILSIVSPLL
ncbi:unnamed protein product [Linum tenue]|uniref:RNase H type-1 domain-containing protein n=1 Tax=Linum tenue TaxID=586396 RepID=A0AAV0L6I3_9ROSI|nr:unnamed protein product [Linum tenue]